MHFVRVRFFVVVWVRCQMQAVRQTGQNLSGNYSALLLDFLQLNTGKKYFVYGAIAFVWIIIPAVEITFTAVTTDILQGKCIRFGVYQSYAMKKSIGFFSVFVTYLLPLAMMIFCYARIVHALRTKVNLSHNHKH